MMLYVFIVSSGTMMKFEMNLAVKNVIELKNEIVKRANIPQEEQVLLCSGGEELQSDTIVGNYYGAGTDTNPIFLFSKYANEMAYPFSSHLKSSIDMNIADDVEGCSKMSPSVGAATVKSSLAQRFAESAVNGRRECDELVHSQHLQQQGWAAVIANLEDFKDALLKRKSHFEEQYHNYLSNRSSYLETIYLFPRSLELLAKIPLLPKLIIENDCTEDDLNTKHTLLTWFIAEPPDVLESLLDKCKRLLDELNEHTIIALSEDFQRILKSVDNTDVKEVKGIEERLSKLNSKIEKAKKYEKDQRDLATWFTQYQGMIAAEPQVLPDLCSTFQKQLEIMLENHKCLRNILDLCTKAKVELSENINARLKYIAKVESDMYQLQMQIMLHENHVQSVISQVKSFYQVQIAPQRYLKMLAEVCRRKAFSTSFMKWAKELSSQASKLYYKELNLRKSFIVEEKNMVDNLFPGLSDDPPPFAVECPAAFDQRLPDIVKEDLDWLKINFPYLAHFCEVIPTDPMPCISQEESDSAFSSDIPSSCVVRVASSEKTSTGDVPTHTLTVPFADYSSLPSEYTSLPNEVFSLTSSPFEDPLLPSHMQERTKTLLLSSKSDFGEHVGGADSDGEGFETVDPYRTSPDVTTSHLNHGTKARPTSSSDVIETSTVQKFCPQVTKARSDGDALSPMQERLKSSDPLGMSGDFQNTEYYIDDSMPSSYSESNATSPLMHGNRMVKSHHVVISELQRQMEEKNSALSATKKNSLEHTHSYIMNLHAKLSALQKFIQELQVIIRSDLSNLKIFVKEELCSRMMEVSEVVSYINTYVDKVEQHMISEKGMAISEIKGECASVEKEFLRKLEVEAQKLSDAENQIAFYEENLRSISLSYEETKQEKELLDDSLHDKNEQIKRMMLEHELEYDSFKNSVKETFHGQEKEIKLLKQNLSDAQAEIKRLELEKLNFEKESYKHHATLDSFQDKQKQLESEICRLREENEKVKQSEEAEIKFQLIMEENAQYSQELKKAKDSLSEYKEEVEKLKASELKDLEDKLNKKYINDLKLMLSHFELALNSTSEKPSCSTDICNTEIGKCVEKLQNIVSKNQEEWRSNLLRSLQEEHEKKLLSFKESAEDTFLKHEEEKIKIIEALRLKHENTLEKLTSRITAENQVSFNEAINSLAKEKDSVIENLRSRISVFEAKKCAIQAYLSQYPSVSLTAVAEGAKAQIECDISSSSLAKQQVEEKSILKFKAGLEALLQLKEMPKPSYQEVRFSSDSCESSLRKMSASASICKQSCFHCANRVSILTCEPGEIVLVCYEEKLEHYIIFHLGSHLHFLHSDSVSALDLKISAGGSQKWAIGTVVQKEFCVTKKVNNRFKLSLGTKFFRVKVEKWNGNIIANRTTSASLQQSIQNVTSTSQSISAAQVYESPSDEGCESGNSSSSMQ